MKKVLCTLLSITLLAAALTGCGRKPAEPLRGNAWLLNTYCTITVYEGGSQQAIDGAFSYAAELEGMLSRTREGSYVSMFNSAEKETGSCGELNGLVQLAQEYYVLSGGLFDISIGPVSKLWDFQAEDPAVPDPEAIKAGLRHVQKADKVHAFDKAFLSSQFDAPHDYILYKDEPGIEIDLGGIAKGYIADKVKDYLMSEGVTAAIINLGGNVVTIGSKTDGSPWKIAIEKPFGGAEDKLLEERPYVGVIETSGGSVVTSGTYERMFIADDGTLYHHVLDPRTGYPAGTDLDSATVTGPESARCDALSTTCLLLGSKAAQALMDGVDGYEYVFILHSGEIIASEASGFSK